MDFESTNQYVVEVYAYDGVSDVTGDSRILTIDVIDVNEAPEFVSWSDEVYVGDSTTSGSQVHQVYFCVDYLKNFSLIYI